MLGTTYKGYSLSITLYPNGQNQTSDSTHIGEDLDQQYCLKLCAGNGSHFTNQFGIIFTVKHLYTLPELPCLGEKNLAKYVQVAPSSFVC